MLAFTTLFQGAANSSPLITFVLLFLSSRGAHSGLEDPSLILGVSPLPAQRYALPSAGLGVIPLDYRWEIILPLHLLGDGEGL